MLNKEICKKCINELGKKQERFTLKKYIIKWDEGYEICWEKYRNIYCQCSGPNIISIEKGPPKWCEYFLEQIMKMDKSHE